MPSTVNDKSKALATLDLDSLLVRDFVCSGVLVMSRWEQSRTEDVGSKSNLQTGSMLESMMKSTLLKAWWKWTNCDSFYVFLCDSCKTEMNRITWRNTYISIYIFTWPSFLCLVASKCYHSINPDFQVINSWCNSFHVVGWFWHK
jgi:hypothetical protein